MKTGDKAVGVFFAVVIIFAALCVMAAGLDWGRNRLARGKTYAQIAYPFPAGQQAEPEEQDHSLAAVGAKFYDRILAVEKKINLYTTDKFIFQPPCLLTKKMIDKTLGLDMTTSLCGAQNDLTTDDDIVTVYDGDYLAFPVDDADISAPLGNLIDFGQQMRAEGRDFLLFLTPGKFAGNESFTDFSQSRHDLIVDSLQAADLDVYDMYGMLGDTPQQIAPFFFKADHHWLPTTGLLACRYLGEYLNENYGYEIDTAVFDQENYEVTVLKDSFLGTQARKVSEMYASKEDFPLVTPKYESDLDVFISETNESLHGSAADTLLDPSALEGKSTYSTDTYYCFYGHGDKDLITIHNNGIHNGKRMLWIKDSMADCMYPHFANAVEYLDVIDLRGFGGSLQTFIEKTKPDTVVVLYGITVFNDGTTITPNAFDFR